jgi:alpha-methylacyl-CoA racemase
LLALLGSARLDREDVQMSIDGPGQLAHVKVLDLSRMYPGAFCTLLMADLGADVVKVEAPGAGDGIRGTVAPGQFNPTHTALNRGKRSLVLDLRNAGAVDVLTRLVQWADIVIESHRPGQLDSFGLGYEAMSVVNPRIIWCSITGFGDHGPHVNAPGHDITYLGYAGVLNRLATGPATPPDSIIAVPVAATMAVIGVLAALAQVTRTGRGERLDVNMTDSAMWLVSEDVARVATTPGPGWGMFAARNVYTCADGREVTVAATEPRSWAALCAALDVPELAGNPLALADQEAAKARLTKVFGTRPAAEWCADPGFAGGVGPVNEIEDLLEDPQVTERGSLVQLTDSPARVLGNPIRFGGADGAEASHGLLAPPELGADTDEALDGAGFDPDEIAALRAAGVIG